MSRDCAIYILFGSILIPFGYVALINTFYDHRQSRDYLPNVRKRFFAAIVADLFGIVATYFLLKWFYPYPFEQMGFRADGLIAAACFPSFLTLIFYTGTLVTLAMDGMFSQIISKHFWRKSLGDLLWIRRAIMAPLTEELAFRGCAAPLLRHCFGQALATFISPISFSLSHIHHIFDDRNDGKSLTHALAERGFQMLYTYLFGIYVTHIFFQTGHIIAPVLCHVICNLLEIPSIGERPSRCSDESRGGITFLLYTLHIGGFISWFLLLPFLLCSDLYRSQ